MYDPVTSSLLFFLLVPGVLITLPPGASILIAAITHAIVFWVVQTYLATYIPWWGIWIAAVVVAGGKYYMGRSAAPTY
jgi:hypothetical protein